VSGSRPVILEPVIAGGLGTINVKISTVRTFEEAADVVIRAWREASDPRLLRIEGFDGVGKSGLAHLVASRIDGEHVESDRFAFRPKTPTP